jgi:hypothetical protein
MDGFRKYLSPLWIFIVGMGIILLTIVFFPDIGTTQSAAIATIGPTKMSAFTFLSWTMNSTRMIIFAFLLFFTLIIAAVVWLKNTKRI